MQQNIYFRKAIWERFKDEEDKSDLINRLLEEHYDDIAVKKAIGTANHLSPAVNQPIKTKEPKPIIYKNTQSWGA